MLIFMLLIVKYKVMNLTGNTTQSALWAIGGLGHVPSRKCAAGRWTANVIVIATETVSETGNVTVSSLFYFTNHYQVTIIILVGSDCIPKTMNSDHY